MGAVIVADPGSCWRASPDEPLTAAWARARRLIAYAAAAGASICKFQLLREAIYPDGSPAQALIRPYCMPDEWLPRLRDACTEEGIGFACTVYRPEDVPLVDALGVPFHKLASFESRHTRLLRAALKTKRDVLVSVGAGADWETPEQAAKGRAYSYAGLERLRPLVCVSAYPAAPAQYNLNWLHADEDGWRACVGVSDHTPGPCHAVGAAAAALGAEYIEKHLRAPDSGASPDAGFAALPEEFAAYVRFIREVESTVAGGVRDLGDEWTWARWNRRTGRRGGSPLAPPEALQEAGRRARDA